MMAQYLALKAEAGDCLLFYRMGDFFELFFDDAKIASAVLDIALTARGEHEGEKIPMCGVPAHAAVGYLQRLIKAGHRVAIADQTESPAEAKKRGGSKALVARAIVRVVTAGTLTEEALLDARAANWCVAIGETAGGIAVAAADVSTGRFELVETDAGGLPAELARLGAAEVIAAEGGTVEEYATSIRPKSEFDSTAAEARLKRVYGVATLDGFGQLSRAGLAAAGGLVAYLEHTAKGALPFLRPPRVASAAQTMAIDAATRESLELTQTQTGQRKGSLLDSVDRTVTGAGARLLAGDIGAPLMDKATIDARLDLVQRLHDDGGLRESLRGTLRSLPDIGRALGRIAAGRGSPRDLGQLRDGLDGAWLLAERLFPFISPVRPEPVEGRDLGEVRETRSSTTPDQVRGRTDVKRPLLDQLVPRLQGHGALIDLYKRALVPMPPIDAADGGYIAEGYDSALDDLRDVGAGGRRAIAALEAEYRARTGATALKIRHNGVLGYHVEVPAKAADPLMAADSGFTHRQTLAGVVRFNAPELHELAMKVTQAGSHALAAEAAHLEDLTAAALDSREAIAATADALARLDVSAGLAERAAEGGWARPHLADHACFDIIGGRHPVVEDAVRRTGERFVANDCGLSESNRLWLVTGPNMGGKSTFLRQNALIAVLAQAGSYVPATSATLGLVDRLFSRVGASDNLARGRSTFMVEMVETAAILAQATPQSFVILDEVGRGTSTYDGLAIAWAVVEAIHEDNRCRCLFATHYHELTRLAERCDALTLHHVRAREWKGDLVLLHEVADGPADRSYGLAVARLAGLPPATIARAKAVLAKLEAGRAKTGGLAAGLDDLPLFAAAVEAEEDECDAIRAEVEALDVDALTPRDALDILYRLKTLACSG
ncbi:DNA mismatch repair protein MutS [Sphingomonas panacisoli]|uniref:DNA mismatch repair protein MutS n=1 Tax=Sphingomonas panacisoli TaxID=1813879 RepID=A0A5B8LPH3_9SPHN|nr:DNA mismatch repair protein MutS [Sphingomonas panacisoli]QDZ09020.1 DNA mismatch repair protein MutS [Sphingomonas panacisoli]